MSDFSNGEIELILTLTDEDFARIVTYIKANFGINLEKKRVLVDGRLMNIVATQGYSSYRAYLDTILTGKDPQELERFVNKLTTNHTFFLREPEHFDFMKETVLPYIERTVTDRDARIWCAASSTGQEPYTMAMVIDEYFGLKRLEWDLKILATDISTDVLAKAHSGIYTDEMVSDVPAKWLKNYFVRIDSGHYQMCERMRKEIIYRQFNLMDPIVYKKPYDLISCRNVMIYFDTETKNDLIERLYDALKPGGYLFIGHAENVSKDSRFEYIKPAIYRRPI